MVTLPQSPFHVAASIIGFALLTACASNTYGGGVFSYSKDRCLGSYNQCRNECASAPNGSVEAACIQRCLSTQSQCYATGDDAKGSSLAQESLIGYAKSREEKEAGFQSYKERKIRERAEAAAEGRDPYEGSEIIEIIPETAAETVDVEKDVE